MKITQQNIADIIKYIRKSKALKQSELCEILDCTQAQISYMENGLRTTPAATWMRFCHHFLINHEQALQIGKVKIKAKQDNFRFKTPHTFAINQHTSGHLTSLFIDFYCKNLGRSSFHSFCQFLRIHPLYFINTNNPINLEFILRLAQELIIKGYLSTTEDIKKFTEFAFKQSYLFKQMPAFQNVKTPLGRLKFMLRKMRTFEKSHFYTLEEENKKQEQLTFSFKPFPYVNLDLWSRDRYVGGFMEKWLPQLFRTFAQDHRKLDIVQVASFSLGDKKAIYRAQIIE